MSDETRIKVWLLKPNDRPFYKLEWVEPGTSKHKSKSTKTADETKANEMRHDLEAALNDGRYQEKSRMPWERFRTKYLDECLVHKRENTRKKAGSVFDRFEELINPQKMGEITETTISAYSKKLRDEGKEPATIHGHLAYLRAALRWAVKKGIIPKCPHIDMPPLPDKEVIRKIVAEEFERLILKAPTEYWRVFCSVAWFTGMRRNEMLALTWDDRSKPCIDLTAKRIHIPAAYNKNKKYQWLPLHPELIDILTGLRARLAEKGKDATGTIFPFHYLPQETSRKFTAIARSAGLKISLHDLRRSFASRYASEVPAPVLQRLMRHASIQTTLKYYTDIDSALESAILKG
jgi:integrase